MPKKTTNNSADVALAKEMIRAYCEDVNISLNRLSEEAGVNQSALCRFVNGERKSLTKTAKKALSYVKKWHKWHNEKAKSFGSVSESEEYKIIEDAVLSYWDGSRRSAELLAEVIKALSPIMAMASEAPRGKSEGDGL